MAGTKSNKPDIKVLNYQEFLALITLCDLKCKKLEKYVRNNQTMDKKLLQGFQEEYHKYTRLSNELEAELDRRLEELQ